MKQIILIGGMPTAGKSTIAEKLSKHFDLPWISTDQVRIIMRTVANRNDHPKLFNPLGYDGEKFLNTFSAQEIADMEYEQGEATWLGIKDLIDNDYTFTKGFIIEGVNILPHLVAQDFPDNPMVKVIFVGDHNEERIRNIVFTRGLWGEASSYPDYVKEKEIQWVLRFSERLKADAINYKLPWIEIEKAHTDLTKVLEKLDLQ